MSFSEPVVIICAPGLGKTMLPRALGEQLGMHHSRAGTFIRSPNPAPSTTSGERIVIDGLDEITPLRRAAWSKRRRNSSRVWEDRTHGLTTSRWGDYLDQRSNLSGAANEDTRSNRGRHIDCRVGRLRRW